jgi:hypothetical protein
LGWLFIHNPDRFIHRKLPAYPQFSLCLSEFFPEIPRSIHSLFGKKDDLSIVSPQPVSFYPHFVLRNLPEIRHLSTALRMLSTASSLFVRLFSTEIIRFSTAYPDIFH